MTSVVLSHQTIGELQQEMKASLRAVRHKGGEWVCGFTGAWTVQARPLEGRGRTLLDAIRDLATQISGQKIKEVFQGTVIEVSFLTLGEIGL